MMYVTSSKSMFVGTLFLFVLLTACKGEESEQHGQHAPLPTVHVQVAQVKEQAPLLQVEVMGTVEAMHSAVIATKVSGNINEMPVVIGSKVNQGDLLIQLDGGEFTAKLQQAKAQLAQAKRNLTRDQRLLKKNAATPEAVKSGHDIVRIAEAGYQEAKTMVDYTTIKAPFDGIITGKMVDVGDLVTAGLPLLQLDDDEALQVVTHIPEKLLLHISLGDTLRMKVPVADVEVAGVVCERAPTADPISRTALVKLVLPATEHLRPGQFARVYINNSTEKTVTVPNVAIYKFGQLDRVFVVVDGTARLRLVRTGARYGESVEILSGLDVGEMVVVETDTPLVDNQPLSLQ